MRDRKFTEAILEATDQAMELDPSVYLIGLGVPDPKGLFNTTIGLQEKYGPKRVLDMPVSENAMTGVGVGSAIMGMRPIMTHQRLDFFLLALDQLINNAAKWHYMFDGQKQAPMVFRLLIGRGWGQGPQHSQSLTSLFAHIPGLKVVAPSNPYDAKGLLIAAIEDNNPVIYLEHRWLHNIYGPVPSELYRTPIGKANVLCAGDEVTIVASSHMVLEAHQALAKLRNDRVSAELIDVRSIKPLDKETICASVRKTGRLLVVDADWKTCGFASEVMATVVETEFASLKAPPVRLTCPDHSCPTSWALANHYYPTSDDIMIKVLELVGKTSRIQTILASQMDRRLKPLDVPDPLFTGPF